MQSGYGNRAELSAHRFLAESSDKGSSAQHLRPNFQPIYHEGLESWFKDVRASHIREFLTFARSVERDQTAILAGLTLPYSTGPVEGHINRLKLIKRQAYGRAGLAYLQHRFLSAA